VTAALCAPPVARGDAGVEGFARCNHRFDLARRIGSVPAQYFTRPGSAGIPWPPRPRGALRASRRRQMAPSALHLVASTDRAGRPRCRPAW